MKIESMMGWVGRLACCGLLLLSLQAQAQTGCLVDTHRPNGTGTFGPTGSNVTVTDNTASMNSGTASVTFRDSAGRAHSTGSGASYQFQSNAARVTWTFNPAVPAHRIGIAISDMGGVNYQYADYPASLKLTATGGATSADFEVLQLGSERLGVYDPSTGIVGKNLAGPAPSQPHGAFLRGTSNRLVKTLRLEGENIYSADWIHVSLVSIPSCVTVRTSTEHGVGTFDFTLSGRLQNFAAAAAGSTTNLSLTTTSTSISDFATADVRFPVDALTYSNEEASQDVVIVGAALPTYWKHVNAYCQDWNYAKTGNPSTNLATLSGRTLTIPASAIRIESNIICSYVQQWQAANVDVVKTNASDGSSDIGTDSLLPGAQTTYSIVATNHGPLAANGAVVRDTVDTGLTCSAAQCTGATGGAVCPTTTLAALTGSGVPVVTFPANSSVTFQVTCATPAATP